MKTGLKDQYVVMAVVKTNICIVCRRCTGHSKQLLRNDGSVNICSSIALIQIRNTATTGRTQPLQISRRDDLRMCLCAGAVVHGRPRQTCHLWISVFGVWLPKTVDHGRRHPARTRPPTRYGVTSVGEDRWSWCVVCGVVLLI